MDITIAPAKPVKAATKSFIIKALIHRAGQHGTFYLSGNQWSVKRSEATRVTKDEGYAVIETAGRRNGINLDGALLTVVPVVKTRGEHGGRD